jgi:hypothetical protein
MLVLDREHVRQVGAEAAARQAVTFLTRPSGPPDGFWIHLDADVFDETIMQSVDDPRPGGLTWDDGIAVLRTALASPQAAGLQVAIYTTRHRHGRIQWPRTGRRHPKRARLRALVPARWICRADPVGRSGLFPDDPVMLAGPG